MRTSEKMLRRTNVKGRGGRNLNKTMGGVNLSDAYFVRHWSAKKKAKEILSEKFSAHDGYFLYKNLISYEYM